MSEEVEPWHQEMFPPMPGDVDQSHVYCIYSRVSINLCACARCEPWREPYMHPDYERRFWYAWKVNERDAQRLSEKRAHVR